MRDFTSIKAFQTYVKTILNSLMNSVFDESDDFEDSPLWNITVVYHANELKLNRDDSCEKLNDITNTPAFTDVYSSEIYTPSVSALKSTKSNLDFNYRWDRDIYDVRVLHLSPYQTVELCKTILFDMINSEPYHCFRFGCGFAEYINKGCRMFAFLAHYYATGYNTSEPELYERAMRLVKSLNKKYVELMTL